MNETIEITENELYGECDSCGSNVVPGCGVTSGSVLLCRECVREMAYVLDVLDRYPDTPGHERRE